MKNLTTKFIQHSITTCDEMGFVILNKSYDAQKYLKK